MLLEELKGKVYVNKERTLYLINDLIEKEFGLRFYENSGGMCFLNQIAYSISAVTNIPAQTIVQDFKIPTSYNRGHSLAELVDFLDQTPIRHGGKSYKFELSFRRYRNINEVIAAVKSGIPVMLITASDHPLNRLIDDASFHDKDKDVEHKGLILGFSDPKNRKPHEWNEKTFHSLLLVGYDSNYKMVIGRESRWTFGYHGYFRVLEKDLRGQTFNQFAFLSVLVENVHEID